jgi:TatD DNase family protein
MGVCYGIHPLEITDAWEAHLEQLRTFLPKAVALGEIGLDFHNLFDIAHVAQMKLQMKVFERQLRLAAHYQLPVVINCRDAFFAIREILEYAHFDVQRVLFHCFVEDAQAAEWILSRGGMVSYSGVLTFKRCGNTPITAAMADLNHIVVETDSPYLAPVPFRGQQNSPEYVRHVVAKLAEVKQLPYDVCAAATVRNAQRFFGL